METGIGCKGSRLSPNGNLVEVGGDLNSADQRDLRFGEIPELDDLVSAAIDQDQQGITGNAYLLYGRAIYFKLADLRDFRSARIREELGQVKQQHAGVIRPETG